MPLVFITCHIHTRGRVWIETCINRTVMGKKQTEPTTPLISRRTGIDRRWITTIKYYPERRSGKDRRLTHHRSFLAPIDSEEQDVQKKPRSDSLSNDGAAAVEKLEVSTSEEPLPRIPESAVVDSAADD